MSQNSATPEWKHRRERSSSWAIKLIVWIALHLGRSIARAILLPVTAYFLLVVGDARRASLNFMRRALGTTAGILDVFINIYSFASCAMDRVFLLSGRYHGLDISLYDPDGALAAVRAGKGALMLTAHLGSFEISRVLGTHSRGNRFRIVMDVDHGGKIMSVLSTLNPLFAESIIDASTPGPALALAIKQAIDRGCVVGIMADRVLSPQQQLEVEFFGAKAHLPSTPLKLVTTIGAPTVLCFGLFLGRNRYALYFEAFHDGVPVPRAQRNHQAELFAQRYAERLEHYARLAPYNWFNFYDFWVDETIDR